VTNDAHNSFDWLIGMLPARRPLRVLDLGCADCPEGDALVAAGADLVGVDLDEAAIVAARAPAPRPASPGPPLPAGVVRWDGDDEVGAVRLT